MQHMQYGWDVYSGDIEIEDGSIKCQSGENISADILFNGMVCERCNSA